MINLPDEIWHTIFIQLTLQQRLDCMLVCRSWWKIIDARSLLYDVSISKNVSFFNRFMDMIKSSPHRASQVVELVLSDCVGFVFNKRALCDTFYNARVIKVLHDSYVDRSTIPHFREPLELMHSKPKIESLADCFYCELASQMLISNLCCYLHTLELSFLYNDTVASRLILSQMVNLPVLKSLTLENVSIGIDELEYLHQSIPSIQNFVSRSMCVLASNSPLDITPATAITNLTINIIQVKNIRTHIQLYNYMAMKYINSKKIEYSDRALSRYGNNTLIRLYSMEIPHFLQLVGSSITSMNFSRLPRGTNVFKVLDTVDSRVERFEFHDCQAVSLLKDLSRFNRSQYIQELVLNDTVVNSLGYLKDMASLTDVNLQYFRDGAIVDLTGFLNAFPSTVNSFKIYCDALHVDVHGTHPSSVSRLNISCNSPSQELGQVLSACFPKMKYLDLAFKTCSDIQVVINKDQPLVQFTCRIRPPIKYGFQFDNLDQTSYHLCNNNIMLARKEDIQDIPCITITTHRELQLSISNGMIKVHWMTPAIKKKLEKTLQKLGIFDVEILNPFPPHF